MTIYYVHGHDGDDANDGLSWDTALRSTWRAVELAKIGDVIQESHSSPRVIVAVLAAKPAESSLDSPLLL